MSCPQGEPACAACVTAGKRDIDDEPDDRSSRGSARELLGVAIKQACVNLCVHKMGIKWRSWRRG